MIFVERRRAGFTAELLWRVGAIWLAVSLIFIAAKWGAITALQLPDADDSLRLDSAAPVQSSPSAINTKKRLHSIKNYRRNAYI